MPEVYWHRSKLEWVTATGKSGVHTEKAAWNAAGSQRPHRNSKAAGIIRSRYKHVIHHSNRKAGHNRHCYP